MKAKRKIHDRKRKTKVTSHLSKKNRYLLKQNKALAKANVNIANLFLELESQRKQLHTSVSKSKHANVELKKKNKALSRANANIANLYLQLENQNKALGKANSNISNLYVDLEKYKKAIEEKNTDLVQANKEIKETGELARIVNSELDIDKIMPIAIKTFSSICEFDGAVIQLLDKEKKHIYIYRYYGVKNNKQLKQWLLDVKETQSNSIKVIQQNKSLYIKDVKQRKMYKSDAQLYKILKSRSIIYFPLEVQENVIGCIFFFCRKIKALNLSEKKIKHFKNILFHMATAIHNAAVHDDLKKTKLELFESQKMVRLTRIFEKFVPKQFLQKIAKKGIDKIKFGFATRQSITILFVDIRQFTTISESLEPNILLNLINQYFQLMDTEIYKYSGFIDKFIGDAMLILFEQENEEVSDATRAVNAAISMHLALKKFNQTNPIAKIYPISVGIGIHTGEVILGTVGSFHRIDTTVIGDNVNIAARLEKMTKLYNSKILISQNTFNKLNNLDEYMYRPLGTTPIRGRKKSIEVLEVFNNDDKHVITSKQKTLPLLKKGIELLKLKDWEGAAKVFKKTISIDPNDRALHYLLSLAESKAIYTETNLINERLLE